MTITGIYVLGWHGQIGVHSLTPEKATYVKTRVGMACQEAALLQTAWFSTFQFP